jgi:23S rRNA (pseudouridine1915-N3)-methyltransferase
MKISILCEGRLNKSLENDLCKIYIDRTLSLKKSGILDFNIKSFSNIKLSETLKKKGLIKNIILDENGKNVSTEQLSKNIIDLNNHSVQQLNFFIGKPEGFSYNVDKFEKMSLGKMTLPHSLARVILCEQIYRCATIITNHPYHKY